MTENLESTPFASAGFVDVVPAAVIAGRSFDSESENALAMRYGRRKRKSREVTFEFTRDPALLHQYFHLYEKECRVITHVSSFRDAEQDYNRKSHILIARLGNLCVGGARLTISSPRKPKSLPVEINGFRLRDHFPELEQKQASYGEFSRLVLLPEFRNSEISRQMFGHLSRKAVALNLSISFAAAPMVNIRAYRLNLIALGIKDSIIHTDIQVPPYPGFEEIKDHILSWVPDKSLMTEADLVGYYDDLIPEENVENA